jgi:hypothetical protein
LESLEKQSYLENTDFHLFQDGQINKFSGRIVTNLSQIDKNIKMFEMSKLPNKTKHVEAKNIGNANNQFNAVEFMSKNYKYFMIIEDDTVLGKDYLKLIRIMIDQFFDYPEVFSLSLGFRRLCNIKDIKQNIDKVKFINEHWWAECWKSENWFKVRPHFLRYLQYVKNVDYKLRPAPMIRRFFHSQGFNVPQTSQDAGKDFALFKTKMKRISAIVNRGFYIGETGIHFRPITYKNYGFADMKPYEFESDKNIERFELL